MYTSSQHGVAKYVRSATARGTRQRGYFAAAVAARSRSRQAIMAAFLRVPLQYRAPLYPLSLSLSLFSFTVFVSLRCFLSLRASFLYRGPLPVLRLCRFLSVLSRLLYPLLRYQTWGPRWYAAQWRSHSSSWSLTNAPPRVAAVTSIYAHSAHSRSGAAVDTFGNDVRRKQSGDTRRREFNDYSCGPCAGVCGIQRRGRRRRPRKSLYQHRWASLGLTHGDDENGGCCRSIADSMIRERSTLSRTRTADRSEKERREDGTGVKIDTDTSTLRGKPLSCRSAPAHTHQPRHTHTRARTVLERSGVPLAASTFVFGLRTGGRRETS